METVFSFSEEEAKTALESIGLDVRFQEMEFEFSYPGITPKKEPLNVWVVINPYTQEPELLREFFSRYLEKRKTELFLIIENKLDVYNLFKK